MQDHGRAVLAVPGQWVQVNRAPPSHRSVCEHGVRSGVVDAVLTIDQEHAPTSLSMEYARWRLPLIKEEVRSCPNAPAYSTDGSFTGAQHTAIQSRAEVAIAEEVKNVKEEGATKSNHVNGGGKDDPSSQGS
ncbi:unnamed protein product [Prorocentrum cordatum]|uniref:Uncharacterized protein n=1 Tax=Prorocentrum cordatum TaxID=2364126 RepID=A0ABN9UVV9_9DINO|nr:unnamed protein product [Polarella glacialis]